MPDLKKDAARFLRDFGEDVVIVENGTTRTVKAIVDRLSPTIGPDGKRLDARTVLELTNDAVLGIEAGAVDLGTVRVRMSLRPGAEAKDWGVAISEDGDGWADAGMIRVRLK